MRISAVVCTRNRGSLVAGTIKSILANDHPSFELIVVDQSTDEVTEGAVHELMTDSRLRYVRSAEKGLSNARNLGIRHARATRIAMTDDDCTVPIDWLTRMEKALEGDGVAIVIGNVVPADYDRTKGFVPGYSQESSFLAESVRDKHRVEGMAACMGLCAVACSALSGFDPSLGAGSRFHSADETDIIIRALLAGYKVLETPDVEVTHFGLREWSEANEIVYNYLYGIGATIAKHVKCGHWSIAHVVAALASRWIFSRPAMDYGFAPGRRVRLTGFASGFRAGLMTRVDRKICHFIASENVAYTSSPL